MTPVTIDKETSLGFSARKLRMALALTLDELSDLSGVSTEKIRLFEEGLPVELNVRRKLLRLLWACKLNQLIEVKP